MEDFKIKVIVQAPDGEMTIMEGSQMIFAIGDKETGAAGVCGSYTPRQLAQGVHEIHEAVATALTETAVRS